MKTVVLLSSLVLIATSAEARRGGRDGDRQDRRARPETISCGLQFPGSTALVAPSQGLVQNGAVALHGEANGVAYLFSVRGKTAVARLTLAETGQVVTASGAIEMLRHGGEDRSAQPASVHLFRRGEDDAQDGNPEREAGFDLGIAATSAPQAALVRLKCQSINQTGGIQ